MPTAWPLEFSITAKGSMELACSSARRRSISAPTLSGGGTVVYQRVHSSPSRTASIKSASCARDRGTRVAWRPARVQRSTKLTGVLLGRRGRPDAHRLDGIIAGLHHLEHVVGELERGARLGTGLEELDDQAVERLRPVGRQIPAHRAIERTDGGRGIGDEAAVRIAMHVLVRGADRIGGEVSDDLLEEVLEGHEAEDVTVLIDHERHAAPVPLKVEQLRIEDRARRHEVGIPCARHLDEPLAIEASAPEL